LRKASDSRGDATKKEITIELIAIILLLQRITMSALYGKILGNDWF
jgi:hypothetical protein